MQTGVSQGVVGNEIGNMQALLALTGEDYLDAVSFVAEDPLDVLDLS